jgi:hypothetical protein
MRQKINLIGPVEPCGLTWLINCLIELNIKCSPDSKTWEDAEGKFRLRPGREILQRWLPALSDDMRLFDFRSDFEITWSHNWISSENLDHKTVFFTREPKTALFSGYKRLGPTSLSFYDYLNEIDPQFLLNRMQIWNLFHGLWSSHPKVKFFLFEDYKKDAIKTLKSVIEFLKVDGIKQKELVRAVEASSFKKAKRSEEKYLSQIQKKQTLMVREGSINLEEEISEKRAYDLIDLHCLFLFESIKSGESLGDFLRNSELNSHVYAYLKRDITLKKCFPNFNFVDESISGFLHITRASVEISRKTSRHNQVILAIQRSILQNFIHDLRLLTVLRRSCFPASNYSLIISLIKIPLYFMRSKMKRVFSSIRNN